VQTVLRATGSPSGYERLKDFTRGRAIDEQSLAAFIETLPLSDAEKRRLKALRPESYTGIAAKLAQEI
jgi:adenylosuccinate lyase